MVLLGHIRIVPPKCLTQFKGACNLVVLLSLTWLAY